MFGIDCAHHASACVCDCEPVACWLAQRIKPNLREFQELAGIASTDEATLIDVGRDLFDRYRIEVIALSMGPNGALLMTRGMVLCAGGLAAASRTAPMISSLKRLYCSRKCPDD